jgi:phosphoribosyl-AMP cyclohydrolase
MPVEPAQIFGARNSIEDVEEGGTLAPRFDYMNAQALALTIETGEAHYFSRSRKVLWHKGATSGLVQTVRELLIDDDQDCVWLRVDVNGGASCHVGYRSCFYRRMSVGDAAALDGPVPLEFTEAEKVFDPLEVYGDAPNPTKL